jgi:hypothetical protein
MAGSAIEVARLATEAIKSALVRMLSSQTRIEDRIEFEPGAAQRPPIREFFY